jgi:hypothetical protein
MPRTRTLLLLVLVPLLAFLVACGGDDDDGGSSSNGDSQPSASDSSGGGGDTSADNGGGDTGGDDSSASDDSGDDGGDDVSGSEILANCPELMSMFGAFTAGAFANPGNPSNADEDLQAAVEVFQNAANNAPSEIKGDMQVMADAFAQFYATLDDLGVNFSDPSTFATLDASQQAELQAAVQALGSPEVAVASDNLTTYFDENCGN